MAPPCRMSCTEFRCSVELPVPPEAAFAFHLDPTNLVRISPPWIRVDRLDVPGRIVPGSRLEIRVRVLGFLPQAWTVEIAELVSPQRLVDVARAGPYRQWRHTHTFRAVSGGSEMIDTVNYVLPFGAVGRFLDPVIHRPFLAAMFRFRHRRTRELLEAGRTR